jgi:hypothetical protein
MANAKVHAQRLNLQRVKSRQGTPSSIDAFRPGPLNLGGHPRASSRDPFHFRRGSQTRDTTMPNFGWDSGPTSLFFQLF